MRQSALDGLARLYIATNKLHKREQTLDTLAGLQNRAPTDIPFPVRSSLITRIRLLLRLRRWEDALRLSDTAIEEARKVADRKTMCMFDVEGSRKSKGSAPGGRFSRDSSCKRLRRVEPARAHRHVLAGVLRD